MNNAAMTYKEECEALRAEVERLNAVIESNIDEGINKIMHMSDEQISALAGFEGRSTEDQETIARQCFEIAEQRADHMKLVEENHELRQQLAASQLEAKRLRESVDQYIIENDPSDFGCACDLSVGYLCGPCFAHMQQTVLRQALSSPASTEVLDAYVTEKVKEKTKALHYQMEHCYSIDHVKIQCDLDVVTKQRDLAVSAATKARNGAHQAAMVCPKKLHVYPALLNMIDVVDEALAAIKESEV